MILQSLAFYAFAGILITSALMVISARNPVHSVLFLILAFFNAAGLFVLLGAEFVAMILVIVYVGAVAVLFLFVVMMLDINFADLRKGAMQYIPLGIMIGGVLLVELVMMYQSWNFGPLAEQNVAAPVSDSVSNAEALGLVLYTDYVVPFQISGLVLLVAMVGAIVLTLRRRSGVLRQNIASQVSRRVDEAIEIKKVPTGTGVGG